MFTDLFHVTVAPATVALEYVRGTYARTLVAGRHRRVRQAEYVTVHLRESLVQLSPQEVLTSDQVSVRITTAFRMRTVDPRAYFERMEQPEIVPYLAVQVALRDQVAGLTMEDVARRTGSVDAEALRSFADEASRPVGIEVLEVTVKDVILPAEVRRAAAQLQAVRAEGLAELERVRSQTAALRAAANAAKILEESPALARLRMIEAAPEGAQVVLHLSDAEK